MRFLPGTAIFIEVKNLGFQRLGVGETALICGFKSGFCSKNNPSVRFFAERKTEGDYFIYPEWKIGLRRIKGLAAVCQKGDTVYLFAEYKKGEMAVFVQKKGQERTPGFVSQMPTGFISRLVRPFYAIKTSIQRLTWKKLK
jgi:hypothetical protein